jgi:hypothetical protein
MSMWPDVECTQLQDGHVQTNGHHFFACMQVLVEEPSTYSQLMKANPSAASGTMKRCGHPDIILRAIKMN